jgi:hypothetical protein
MSISPGLLKTLGHEGIPARNSRQALLFEASGRRTQAGLFPEPSKSILVVQEQNREKAKEEFLDFGFQIVMGPRYVGSFIGEAEAQQHTWVKA